MRVRDVCRYCGYPVEWVEGYRRWRHTQSRFRKLCPRPEALEGAAVIKNER